MSACHTSVYVGCKERGKYAGEVPTDSQVQGLIADMNTRAPLPVCFCFCFCECCVPSVFESVALLESVFARPPVSIANSHFIIRVLCAVIGVLCRKIA
jgi:hypothetical protein